MINFLGLFTSFDSIISRDEIADLQYLTKYQQTGPKSNVHATVCCVYLIHY